MRGQKTSRQNDGRNEWIPKLQNEQVPSANAKGIFGYFFALEKVTRSQSAALRNAFDFDLKKIVSPLLGHKSPQTKY